MYFNYLNLLYAVIIVTKTFNDDAHSRPLKRPSPNELNILKCVLVDLIKNLSQPIAKFFANFFDKCFRNPNLRF